MNITEDVVTNLETEVSSLKLQLKQAQAQLDLIYSQGKTDKERLQASINSMLDGTLFHSVRSAHSGNMHFDYVSGTWEKVLGVTAEESLADIQKVLSNIEPDDLEKLLHLIYKLNEPFESFTIDVRYYNPAKKRQMWLQITSNPFRAGDYIYADGFIFDITKRKEAEQSLAFEQKRLNALNNMPDGTLYRTIRDKTGVLRFDHLYGKWEEISGVTVADSLADLRNVFGRFEPNDLKRLMQAIEESLNPLRSFEIECRYRHPKKKGEYWLLISSHPRYEGDEIVADGFIFDITPRKIAEQKLKVEKERLETVGNHIPDGVLFRFEIDKETKNISLAYASGTWEKITGVPTNVAMADINSVLSKIHQDDVPILMQEVDKCVQSLTTLLCEYRMIVDGATRWLQITSHPREEGDVIVADGIITDITRHKEVEIELKAEKNRLQTIGDNIPGGALFQFIRDRRTYQMRISYTSGTWQDVTGISSKQAAANIVNVFDAIHPDILPNVIQSIEDSAKSMDDLILEFRAGNRWLHIVARPRNEGTFIIWDGIISNITSRKEIEHELETEKIRLQNLGDNLPAGSLFQFIKDKKTLQMQMSYVSASWEDVTGIPIEDALKDILKIFSKIPQDEYNIFLKAIKDSEHTMSDVKQEIQLGNRWLQWISRPRNEDAFIVWDGIIMNITARKEAETELIKYRQNLELLVQERTDELTAVNEEMSATNEELFAVNEELASVNEKLKKYQTELEKMVDDRTKELELAKDKAEESDRLKSAFLANMSHEIRTPLNGIIGFLQFIDKEEISPELRQEYVNIIKSSSAQLTNIIDDIIDVSKIEAKQMKLNPLPVHLNVLMNEMRLFFETFLQTRNKEHIKLIFDNSKFVEDCLIFVDETRLRQIITNLIGNSVKFTHEGYIRFSYRRSSNDMLEFEVEDTGIGLADDQKEVIFERFRQAELGNDRVYGGTGLGLTISRSLVQLKGGNMWVKSTEGVGSTFYFTIPYLPVTPEDEHIFSKSSSSKNSSDTPIIKKNILLVEPFLLKSIYLEKLISATDATVIKAINLEEWYVNLTQAGNFDMVIVDSSLFCAENSEVINNITNLRHNLKLAIIFSDTKTIEQPNLKYTVIESPIGYEKILKILT